MLDRPAARWGVSLAATVASNYGLDALATVTGAALVATGALAGVGHQPLVLLLAGSYLVWGLGLRANLRANQDLLDRTGTSTNVLSKAAHDLAAWRTTNRRVRRIAAAGGYLSTQVAAEAVYYAGAFGATLLVDSLTAKDAIVFLAGANLAAGAYEYGLAGLTAALLKRRGRVANSSDDHERSRSGGCAPASEESGPASPDERARGGAGDPDSRPGGVLGDVRHRP